MSSRELPSSDPLTTGSRPPDFERIEQSVKKAEALKHELFDIALRGYRDNPSYLAVANTVVQYMHDGEILLYEIVSGRIATAEAQAQPLPGVIAPTSAETSVEDPEKKVAAIVIDGQYISSDELGLTHPNDLAFLQILPTFNGWDSFRAKDFFEQGFRDGLRSDKTKTAFFLSRRRVLPALERVAGRPIVASEGTRGGSWYKLLADVTRPPLDDDGNIDYKKIIMSTRTVAAAPAEEPEPEDAPVEIGDPRSALGPHVESFIAERKLKQNKNKRSGHVDSTDNTVEVLRLHWGLSGNNDSNDWLDIQAISYEISLRGRVTLSPYSVKILIKDALKEIARDNKAATEAAKCYLEFIDSQ